MADLEISKSKSFDAHLELSPPSRLYHYTTQSGLLGILSSGELHATKPQYFNDATDFWLAVEIAMERINHWKSQAGDKASRLSGLIARMANTVTTNLFAACFCENGDLLSQWRGYSSGHYGYSLGMDISQLARKAKPVRFELGKCIYDREIQRRIIDELISDAIEGDDRAAAFERGLLRAGAFFKHETFRNEEEWRIVSPVEFTPEIGFRLGVSMPTPYCGFSIGAGNDSAVRHAYVGPCPHPLLAKAAVAMIFRKHDVKADAVNSSIAYRT